MNVIVNCKKTKVSNKLILNCKGKKKQNGRHGHALTLRGRRQRVEGVEVGRDGSGALGGVGRRRVRGGEALGEVDSDSPVDDKGGVCGRRAAGAEAVARRGWGGGGREGHRDGRVARRCGRTVVARQRSRSGAGVARRRGEESTTARGGVCSHMKKL